MSEQVGVARGHQPSGVVGPTPHGRWMIGLAGLQFPIV